LKEEVKTGTTTVGLVGKDIIVLAADQRATMGHLVYDDEAQKLYKITEHIGVTNAGAVGDSLVIIRFLRSHANLYEIERQTRVTAKALASYLSNILNSTRFYPFAVQFLLGGVNQKPELFEVTAFGGVLERKKYAASGSGTELALTTLDQEFKPGMTEEEGVALAVKAVKSGTRRDVFSGGKVISVMVIDKDTIRTLSEQDIKKHLEKLKTREAE